MSDEQETYKTNYGRTLPVPSSSKGGETMELFENHAQGDGGTELSEDEGTDALPTPEPADDTAEAQPSLDEATGGGRTGTIAGGATDGGSVEGGPASSDVSSVGDATSE